MTSLGTFGAAVREFDPDDDRDTFEFFGEKFTVEGVIPGMLQFQISAALAGKISNLDGDAAIYEALRCALTKPPAEPDGEGDESAWERFYRLAVDRRDEGGDLAKLVLSITGAQAGRPTGQQPTLPDGPLPTSTDSNSSVSDTLASQGYSSVAEVLGG